MTLPSLSVVMANYNHAHYLRQSLEAILNQSAAPREVIVVDDASTDESIAVVEDLMRRHSNLRLIRNETNKGAMAAANRGFLQAGGDCIVGPAADDLVLPGFFERSLDMLERHPQAGFCSALSRRIGPNGEDMGPYRSVRASSREAYFLPREASELFVRLGHWPIPNTVVYRRKALEDIGWFNLAFKAFADGFAQQVLALRHGACFIPEFLAAWREAHSGYAARAHADFENTLDIVEAIGNKMRGEYKDLFTESHARSWRRNTALAIIDGELRKRPHCYDHLKAWGDRFGGQWGREWAFFAALRVLLKLDFWLCKTYVLSRHGLRSQGRIAASKIKSLARRPR